jgi:hypothetical protein
MAEGPASCFFAIDIPLLGKKKREKTASKGCQDSMSSEASQIMEHTVCDRAMNILIDKQRQPTGQPGRYQHLNPQLAIVIH